MQTAAALTMVRDDAFFLKAWLAHYGTLLGRENCYIVNHGRGGMVAELAQGCNVIGLPGDPHRNFDIKRWRLLNGIVQGLRNYYRHVIVGDVDELVVLTEGSGGCSAKRLDLWTVDMLASWLRNGCNLNVYVFPRDDSPPCRPRKIIRGL